MGLIPFFGRRKAIRERIVGSRERLFRVAYSWCHDRHLADDLSQETILVALEKIAQLRSEDALDAWTFRIMQNVYRKQFRRSRYQVEVDSLDEYLEDDRPAEHDIERAEEILQVRNGLAQLKESQRMIVTLIDIEGFSYRDTAEILEIPIGTVMSRLSRAREALSKQVERARRGGESHSRAGHSHLRVMK